MKPRLPITGFGIAVLAVMAASFVAGWSLGWLELMVVAVGCAVALMVALPFIIGGGELHFERTIDPERVEVGEGASSVLTITNQRGRASSPRIIRDVFAGRPLAIDVPAIGGNAVWEVARPLPTNKRGVIKVGPAVIAKGDPLGLMGRDLGRTDVSELMVHPRVIALASMRAGFARDLDGPTFDNSPAGTVAFHAIREYTPGDDVRHIHWMSTARTGDLMVRHYVDNRRPLLSVIVDADKSIDDESFERGLEVAASHVVSAIQQGRAVSIWVGSQEILTSRRHNTANGALDDFCRSAQSANEPDLALIFEKARRVDPEISATLVVTGKRSAAELSPVATAARKQGAVIFARFVPEGTTPVAVPRATVFDCNTLEDFATRWSGIVR